jgi:hypothetical protein
MSFCLSARLSVCLVLFIPLLQSLSRYHSTLQHSQTPAETSGAPRESIYSPPFIPIQVHVFHPGRAVDWLATASSAPISKKARPCGCLTKTRIQDPNASSSLSLPFAFFQTNPQSKWHSVMGRNSGERREKRQDKTRISKRHAARCRMADDHMIIVLRAN